VVHVAHTAVADAATTATAVNVAFEEHRYQYNLPVIPIQIQNIVKKNTPLLKNSNDNPFLENACCNSSKNTSEYFMSEDNSIETTNKQVKFYNNILNSIDILTYAPQLYNQENTKQKIISQTTSFSEDLVYKAFIYFCNFANLLPIDEELKGLCLDKPTNFDSNKQLKEIIESLKSEGKIYNFSSFVELIHIISKKNIIHIATNYPIINNIELIFSISAPFVVRESCCSRR
jgi:hypothetical protein